MIETETWLNSGSVCARYNITATTLNRWDRDEKLGFPKPMIVQRRKLYPLSKLETWERTQAAAARRKSA